jgi:hypothetical protein
MVRSPRIERLPGQVGVGGESGQGSKDEDGAKAEREPRSKVGTLPKHLWQQAVMGVYLVQMLATVHSWHALPIKRSSRHCLVTGALMCCNPVPTCCPVAP